MKVYHSRFKNSNTIYYIVAISIALFIVLYVCLHNEEVTWYRYVMFGTLCVNAAFPWLMLQRERAELDETTRELRVKPGKRLINITEIRAVEVVHSKRGKYQYITIRIGQYDFQRLHTNDYKGLIADLKRLNPIITVS